MPKAKLTTRERTTSNVSTDTLAKGTQLTHAEADSNFINLRDQSFGLADDSSTVLQVSADKTITVAGGTNCTTSLSGDTLTINATPGASVDLGDLNVNGTTLAPVNTNSDLKLEANGTGDVNVEELHFDEGTATINSQTANQATITYTPTSNRIRDRLRIFAGNVSNTASSGTGSEIEFMIKSGTSINGFFFRDLNAFSGNNNGDARDFTYLGTNSENVESPHLWLGAGGKADTSSCIKIESLQEISGSQQTGNMTINNGTSTSIYENKFAIIKLSSLPTSDPTNAGQLWNDSGTLKISAG